jgi:phosphatidylserine/phosphatidylglycerophosphate/cardiolipin synthase-like enzyme
VLAELARERWTEVTGETLPSCRRGDDRALPDDALPRDLLLRDVRVGIARTSAAHRGHGEIREVEALTLDALAAARESVYIESQYLTSAAVCDGLLELLQRPAAPDVVIVVRKTTEGLLQRLAMGGNRTRLLRRLTAADRGDRLRVYYPVVRDAEQREYEIFVHSKVLAVDDWFLRVGSSNLNNRSMGVDSECDVAVEADDAAARHGVRRVVVELLAEHLGRSPEHVARVLKPGRSLIDVIARLNCGPRKRLVRLDVDGRGPHHPIPWMAFADPARPLLHGWPFHRRRSS